MGRLPNEVERRVEELTAVVVDFSFNAIVYPDPTVDQLCVFAGQIITPPEVECRRSCQVTRQFTGQFGLPLDNRVARATSATQLLRRAMTQATDRPRSEGAPAERRSVEHLQALPVGWAAILLLLATIVLAFVASRRGLDPAAAAFAVVAVLVGMLLGIASWDFSVTFLARRRGQTLRLPHTITLDIPRWIVPYMTPVAFVGGILLGHLIWH